MTIRTKIITSTKIILKTGEAEYVNTMAPVSEELFGMFVTSTQANASIVSVDPSDALVSGEVFGFPFFRVFFRFFLVFFFFFLF